MKKPFLFLISILICSSTGFIGSLFTAPNIGTWYTNLIKPNFNPPNWIFSPVWTGLFILMGISLFLILKIKNNQQALFLFALQLILNIAWSFLFFQLQNPLLAFMEILVLLLLIILTILKFYKLNKLATYLLLPYLFWVSFATILNFAIYRLN